MGSRDTAPDGGIDDSKYQLDYRSGMRDCVAKADFDYQPLSSHKVKFGAQYTFHTFIPETASTYGYHPRPQERGCPIWPRGQHVRGG